MGSSVVGEEGAEVEPGNGLPRLPLRARARRIHDVRQPHLLPSHRITSKKADWERESQTLCPL